LPERELCCSLLTPQGRCSVSVADLLPKRTRQGPEISGKRGTQTVESNEINILEKTLNQ
jgi:hypothetical protein